MALLSRMQILEVNDLKTIDVDVPEWPNADGTPGMVRFRQLSAEEAMRLTDEMKSHDDNDGMYVMLARTMCDENGNAVFTLEDVPALRKKSMRVLMRLQDEALRINNMLGKETTNLKNV
jgi:hypothetical protein